MKKHFYSIALCMCIYSFMHAQYTIDEATIKINNLSQEAFAEGSNEFSAGTANKVKLTWGKKGDSNTFSISQAGTITCDGETGKYITNLSYNNTNSNEYAYIQIENTGTSNITHVAFRGWYNTANGNNMLTYGYSTTTEDENEFTVPFFMGFWEDTPLYFQSTCSVGQTPDASEILEIPGARFIRLTSSPTFPNLPVNAFMNANTHVAVYGIYIWTDDPGIPSGTGSTSEEQLTMDYNREYITFSEETSAEITDLSGRLICTSKEIKQLPIQHLNQGMYLVKATTGNGKSLVKKIYH